MARISLLLLVLGAVISLVAASSAPTFCKCTCFKNSTIIPLGPKAETSRYLRRSSVFSPELAPHLPAIQQRDAEPQPKANRAQLHPPRSKSKSCSECTKAFCLSQGIDFCKKAGEEDVTTLCFQRDSNKDKIIVWGFMICIIGLLGWAAFKRAAAFRQRNPVGGGQSASYAPMPGNLR
ncbi:putative MFS transporter [Thelonectria olida]|uniref:MFS transporter n=1 Tax=Thelonectria olida TaxID=1576542 RepID=A0A9P9AVJ7_9HYPO|nr:putative MFS transporter [Thelonectria olida]